MVTIPTPWRQWWEADSGAGEVKGALRDERKMMAGIGEEGWCKEKSGENGEGDVTEAIRVQPWQEGGADGGERNSSKKKINKVRGRQNQRHVRKGAWKP